MQTSPYKWQRSGGAWMLAACALLTGWGGTAMAADTLIQLDMEQTVTGVIDQVEGDQLQLNDMGFVILPSTRVLNRNGRELQAFHLNPGQEVEVRFDPRGEPRPVIDITLLRRGR
ncbi:hypothetical protein [Cobetia marina]|uniref:hypothetical protein n=1 Tax=Cobetia marina TaxID=28258 RepID=UPI0038574F38